MKKSIILLCLVISSVSFAQNVSDALRYSFQTYGSSARNASVNNSISALGTDFGALSQNPAGLAAFNRSELSFGLSLTNYTTNAKLEGSNNASLKARENKFGVPSFGIVFAKYRPKKKWKTANFAMGMNNLASYRQESEFSGTSNGSIINAFAEQAQGKTEGQMDPFGSQLAFYAGGLIPDSEVANNYFTDIPAGTPVAKSQLISNTGYMNEFLLSFAGNYKDKISIGATVGIPVMRFNSTKIYEESDPTNNIDVFNATRFEENLDAEGTGINLKLGVNFRVNQQLRVGAAIHTPTFLSISESFVNTLIYDYTENGVRNNAPVTSPAGLYDYSLVTPWRASGNVGVVVGKQGFITADVEYVDYPSASFSFDATGDDPSANQFEIELNKDVSRTLAPSVNLRVGGELAVDDFRFRAGYGLIQSPFESDRSFNTSVSGGIGARIDKFFIELGYVRFIDQSTYLPYSVTENSEQPIVNTERISNRFLLTIGFKF